MRAVELASTDGPLGSPILYFAIALAIGLLIGSERERKSSAMAGLRTFALIALFGTLCGMLADTLDSAWVLAAGLASVAATMVVADLRAGADAPGTTTVVATLVTFALGAVVWLGYPSVAVMVGIAVTVLLYFKPQLERASNALSHQDWISILRFAVVSLIVLPILPDQGFGPYQALNPYNIWLMVVLISGISLAGYLLLRVVGTRHGALLAGASGGLVSSTATTLAYGRMARDQEGTRGFAVEVILLANITVLFRIAVITLAVEPGIARETALLLVAPLAVGLAGTLLFLRRLPGDSGLPVPQVPNPVGLKTSLGFGALYGAVLLLAAWVSDVAGPGGLYAVALVSGATDVDAITLSVLRMFDAESIEAGVATTAIGLALASNTVFKVLLLAFAADRWTVRRAGAVLLAMAIALGASIVLA